MRSNVIAVVTGAGSGVGEAVARELGRQGARVALVGRRVARVDAVARSICDEGGDADAYACDVAAPEQVEQLARLVVARFGPPNVLVNSAGVHCEMVPIAESTPSRWIETMQINLIGSYLTCRAFMGEMIRQGWGRIINVTSASSLTEPGNVGSVYQLSKVALNHFTRQLAKELEGTGVTANVIHPGEVKTEMWASIKADASSRAGPGRAAMRWVDWVDQTGGDPPEKAAELVRELLEPASDAINGRFLWIKDGLQKPRPSW